MKGRASDYTPATGTPPPPGGIGDDAHSEWSKERLRELSEAVAVGRPDRVPESEVNFIHDCRVLLNQQKSGLRGWLPWLSLLMVALLLLGASRAELEEVTRGMGKVIPSQSVQLIQSLEGGIVQEILVDEGQRVEKGQPLLRIQDAIFAANYAESLAKRDQLTTRLARHRAESAAFGRLEFPEDAPESLVAVERELFEKRKTDYEVTREALENRLTLARQEEALLEAGRQSKSVSPVELIRVQKEVADLDGQLRNLRSRFVREAMENFDRDNAEYITLSHAIGRDKDRLDRTVIFSPVRGTINQIHINTIGRVIGSGADIMEIVPLDDTLLVEANVRPSDIAFIRPGQKANVKFTAYDFAVYGGLEGTVERMGVNTITDEKGESFYQIKVRTSRNTLGQNRRGEELEIMPGMVTEVDVLTGRKTVLNYLLRPFNRARERALRER